MKIYLDGQLVDEADAKVSVFDHGLLYGDGVFEGIRFYNGRVFKLEEHMDRLYDSAKVILLDIPMSKADLTQALLDTVRANGERDGYIRLVITRGVGDLGINPKLCAKPSIIIISAKIKMYSEEMYRDGLEIITCATRRTSQAAVPPAVKSLNYLNNIMAKIEAHQAGVPEALMLNEAGYIAECTADNFFMIKGGTLFTPPVSAGALRGITRGTIMELAEEMGIPIKETELTRYDVFVADECFLTGTGAEMVGVVMVDSRVISDGKPGPITQALLEKFRQLTRSTGTPIFDAQSPAAAAHADAPVRDQVETSNSHVEVVTAANR